MDLAGARRLPNCAPGRPWPCPRLPPWPPGPPPGRLRVPQNRRRPARRSRRHHPAATSRTAAPGTARSAELSAASRTSRPAHHHAEVGLRILRHSPGSGCPRPGKASLLFWPSTGAAPGAAASGRSHLALQLRFKLIPAACAPPIRAKRCATGDSCNCRAKSIFAASAQVNFLVAASKPNIRTSMEQSPAGARGERVVAVLVRGGDQLPAADGGRDGRAGNGLVRRLDEAALGIQPSAGGEER
jgi:hypothetical protein